MTNYVVGFLFSTDLKYVALIRKNRPQWQAGRLNGIGGHVEEGETFHEAMSREFWEETGLRVAEWNRFCTLVCPDATLGVFYATDDFIETVQTITDEEIGVFYVDDIMNLAHPDPLPNIRWLIHMALSFLKGEKCPAFTVTEAYTPEEFL